MAYEMRAGQGTAFKNKDKTEDWHAPYRGEIMLPDGTLYYLDVKPGTTKAGDPWFAVKIGKPKQPKQMATSYAPSQPVSQHQVDKGNAYQPQPDLKNDIPW